MSAMPVSEGVSETQPIEVNSDNVSKNEPANDAKPTTPEESASKSSEAKVNEESSEATPQDASGHDDGDEESNSDDLEDDSEYDSDYGERYVMPKKTLSQLAQEGLIKNLSKAIDSDQAAARYCCGGSIPVNTPGPEPTPTEVRIEKDDKAGGEKGKKVEKEDKPEEILKDHKELKDVDTPAVEATQVIKVTPAIEITPTIQVAPPVTIRWDCTSNKSVTRRLTIAPDISVRFDKLVKACGRNGLEQSKFTIDFHPQDHGILDAVSQILLPSWKGKLLSALPEHRGIKVEMCRLHVSTAVSQSKIRMKSKHGLLGQLIVCLPTEHKGGCVTVSDEGISSIFDWSDSEEYQIHWVALMKNCTLEHSPVTEGTQIILTYDLVVTQRVGDGIVSESVVDPKLSPLYQGVRDMLLEPGFMKLGGILGYYCRHPYSHTSPKMGKRLPSALQGVDMVLYSVFKSLGLKPQVGPILDPSDIQGVAENQFERVYGDEYDMYGDDEDIYDEFMEGRQRCYGCQIGEAFHELRIGTFDSIYNEGYGADAFDQCLAATWKMKEQHGVTWLNTPWSGTKKPRELAVVMMEDGDDEGMVGVLRVLIPLSSVFEDELGLLSFLMSENSYSCLIFLLFTLS
ncbi:hypothetical protein VTL71DRAFT_8407 [Oculimacula yallundae]|uniref:Uncharacterized protein n=1 Tax=Oculimacula yallundae TaxID=86028 RepID=A0ABR4CZW7_9HELO